MLIKQETVEAFTMKGRTFDCGDKLGYMQAFVEYSLHHPKLGAEFKTYLKQLATKI